MHFLKKKFFTCMCSLRNDMYNCMICFLKNKFYMVKKYTQKREHSHCIGFFRIAFFTSLDEWK